jgi:protein SCO1
MRRRSVILGLGGLAGAAAFTLGIGAWRSRDRTMADLDRACPSRCR